MNYYKDKREGFRGFGEAEMRGHHKHQEHHGEHSKYTQHHDQMGYGGPHRHPWKHVCEGCKIFEMMHHEGFHEHAGCRGHEGFDPRGYERSHGHRECVGHEYRDYRAHGGFDPKGYERSHGNRECRNHEGFAPSGYERTCRESQENEEFDVKNYQEDNEHQDCGRFNNQNIDEKIVFENKEGAENNTIKEHEKTDKYQTATDEQVESVQKNHTKEKGKSEEEEKSADKK
ncbi:hypothetical protein ACTPDI_01425 [Clostridioides difficile]